MGLAFSEVMRGALVDRWGRRRAADFEIKAEASHLGRFVRTGAARITGVVHALPWADHAPLQGEIRISPWRSREIAYAFDFMGVDERRYTLTGHKTIRWRRPRRSFTRMSAELSRDGERVASGELIFDLAEAGPFLTSWTPVSGIVQRPLHKASPLFETDDLLGGQRASFAALAEAALVPGAHIPAPDDATLASALAYLSDAPADLLTAYRAALRGLDALSLATHGRPFAALDVATRRALLDGLAAKSGGPLPPRLAVQLLTLPLKAAHLDRRDYLDAIGFPPPRAVAPEPRPRWLDQVVAAEQLGAVEEVHADVVVVGTGAGGAAVAASLAKRGLAVAIVEEGRYHRRDAFTGAAPERVRKLWRYAGMNVALGTPVTIPIGRMVGGTTAINSGTCFPTPDHVLAEWREGLGFPDDFAPAAFHRYSRQVAEMLQVAPGSAQAVGKIAGVVGRGADHLGFSHGPLPRNAPGCPGAGECIIGCPEGAKRSTDASYIPAALQAGAQLYVGLPVTRLLRRGRRVIAIEARGADQHGAPKVLRVFADRVVLACGSLLSPLLLRQNGFTSPAIGQNLSVHPALGQIARMPASLEPWNAIPQGYTVDALHEDGICFEGYWLPPSLLAAASPWVGAELTRWMDDFPRLAQFGFMVRDRGDGHVSRGLDGRPQVHYRLSQRSMRRLTRGAALCAELLLAGGATEVCTGIARAPVVRSPAEARALAQLRTRPSDFGLLGAHPLGTCRMGGDPSAAVVDFDHRVYGTDNLHIVDGSSVPTSLGVNPQVTIMALALRAADRIAAALT